MTTSVINASLPSDKQMYQVQQAVKAVDPASFMVVLESNEVHGEGFRYIQMGD